MMKGNNNNKNHTMAADGNDHPVGFSSSHGGKADKKYRPVAAIRNDDPWSVDDDEDDGVRMADGLYRTAPTSTNTQKPTALMGQRTLRWLQGLTIVAIFVVTILIVSRSASSSSAHHEDDMPADMGDMDAHPTTTRLVRHEVTKLVPPDESDHAHFGMTIAIMNDVDVHHCNTIWIASPSASTQTDRTLERYVGRVYAFDDDMRSASMGGTTGEVKFETTVPATTNNDAPEPLPSTIDRAWFGSALAVAGDTLFVGAPGLNTVYEYMVVDDERLVYQSTLFGGSNNNENATNATVLMDSFGMAVAHDGEYLIVGDTYAGGTDYQSAYGRIHVYRLQRTSGSSDKNETTTYVEIQTIEAPEPQHGEMFGGVLTYRGDTLIVGDFLKSTERGGPNSGCVYIYRQDATTGMFGLTQTLVAAESESGAAAHEGFGASVAMSDSILVIGTNDREGRTMESLKGGAFVYRRSDVDDTWEFESLLLAHDQTLVKGQFGGGVAVYGETVVVGSQEIEDDRAGKVYVFQKNTATAQWEDVMELAPSDPSEGHHFGRIVAIYNNTVVVGAFMDNERQDAGGSAYIFHLHEMEMEM
jgi:hypothetical protein